MIFRADFGPKFSKIFGGFKIFGRKSREMAPKCVPFDGMQHRQDRQRSASFVWSVYRLRRVRLRAISSGFRTENFEKILRPRKFFVRIAPKCVPPDDMQSRNDPQRSPSFVPSGRTLRRVRLRDISSGFRTEISKIFGGFKIFGPKSREICLISIANGLILAARRCAPVYGNSLVAAWSSDR